MLVAVALLCLVVPHALSQEGDAFSIRVESNQVLVPVIVFDKAWVGEPFTFGPGSESYCAFSRDMEERRTRSVETYVPAECDRSQLRNLPAKDFHVFEDGIEQTIQSVISDLHRSIRVRDNLGDHYEDATTPQGKWSTADVPHWMNASPLEQSGYLLAFAPQDSKEGSCHKILVKVDRRGALVFSRSQYCKVRRPSFDPLKDTEFGKQMEVGPSLAQTGKIELSLQAGVFFPSPATARIQIVVEFPWGALKHEYRSNYQHGYERLDATIGILGIIKQDDRTLVRFSDYGCCSSDVPHIYRPDDSFPGRQSSIGMIPARYETQLNVPAGEYSLRIVLSDGSKFGRAELPVAVGDYDGRQLAVSSVMLCKRFHLSVPPEQEVVAPKYVRLVSKGIEYIPAGNTRFKKNVEPLIAYFEVYPPVLEKSLLQAGRVHLRIVEARSSETKVEFQAVDLASYVEAGGTAIHVARQIPMDKLTPGAYRLEVQATDSTGRASTWRTAMFTVE